MTTEMCLRQEGVSTMRLSRSYFQPTGQRKKLVMMTKRLMLVVLCCVIVATCGSHPGIVTDL